MTTTGPPTARSASGAPMAMARHEECNPGPDAHGSIDGVMEAPGAHALQLLNLLATTHGRLWGHKPPRLSGLATDGATILRDELLVRKRAVALPTEEVDAGCGVKRSRLVDQIGIDVFQGEGRKPNKRPDRHPRPTRRGEGEQEVLECPG